MVDTQTPVMPFARSITAGLRAAMAADSRVMLLGEDIGRLGGVFTVTAGLQEEFGVRRVVDTPLSEGGIIGSAIGLAKAGFRPVCEIQFDGFIFPGFDQITSQLSRMTTRHAGSLAMPVVVRVPYGGGIGAVEHHQESPEAYFAHTPGLRVVSPGSPDDAYWMIQQAIESDDPVLFFEPKRRYWQTGPVELSAAVVGLHRARVLREGTDVTLVGWGAMVGVMADAALAAEQDGVSAEVIDLRSLAPIDYGPILRSAEKTGRVVVVQEAPASVSVASELAAQVSQRCFFSLEAPVIRVGGFDVPFPPARLERLQVPDVDRVLEGIQAALDYSIQEVRRP